MAQNLILDIAPRENRGTSKARRLRNLDDVIPGVVYGAGEESVNVALESRVLSQAEQTANFMSQIIELKMGRKKQQVVIREVQRHPLSDRIIHIDFLRIREDREIQVSVPIRFTNEDQCVGVRMGGGTISHNLIEVEVSCLPKNLPEAIIMDMSDVELGSVVHLSGLNLPAGVSIPALSLSDGNARDLPVVSVSLMREEVLETEAEEEGFEFEGVDEAGEPGEDTEAEPEESSEE